MDVSTATATAARRHHGLPLAVPAVLVGLSAAVLVTDALLQDWYATVLNLLLFLLGAAWVLARAPVTGRPRGWRLVAVIGAVYALAWVGWVASGEPRASAWDAAFIAMTALVGLAALVLVRDRRAPFRRSLILDAWLMGIAAAALTVTFLMPEVLIGSGGDDMYARGLAVAYPLADGIQLALIAAAGALTGWRGDRPLALLATAFLLLFAGDVAYLDRTMQDVAAAGPAHALWIGTVLLMVLAVSIDRAGPPPEVPARSWPPLVAPLLAVAAGLAILVADDVMDASAPRVALGVATVALGTARLALFYAEDRTLNEHLETATRLARNDPLTGLANHRTFQERLAEEFARAERSGEPLGLVIIDLDHFKDVNDTLGHQAGDLVLREVADRLRAQAREGDVVGRLGGEEFGWILPGCPECEAWEAAERAREAVREAPIPPAGTVTMSAGVTDRREAGTPAQMVHAADRALYVAKAAGRDAVVRHTALR